MNYEGKPYFHSTAWFLLSTVCVYSWKLSPLIKWMYRPGHYKSFAKKVSLTCYCYAEHVCQIESLFHCLHISKSTIFQMISLLMLRLCGHFSYSCLNCTVVNAYIKWSELSLYCLNVFCTVKIVCRFHKWMVFCSYP